MEKFGIIVLLILAIWTTGIKSKENNFRSIPDQIELKQFKAYWRAFYPGAQRPEMIEFFGRLLAVRRKINDPSFTSMKLKEKLRYYEEVIKIFDQINKGPSPSQLAELQQADDSTVFVSEYIFVVKNPFSPKINYEKFPFPEYEYLITEADKELTFFEFLDNYLVESCNLTNYLESYNVVLFHPELVLVPKRSGFGNKFDVDVKKMIEKFFAWPKWIERFLPFPLLQRFNHAGELLVDIDTFPEAINTLDNIVPMPMLELMHLYANPEVGRKLANAVADFYNKVYKIDNAIRKVFGKGIFADDYLEFIKNFTPDFIQNNAFDPAVMAMKAYKESKINPACAEHIFCGINAQTNRNLTEEILFRKTIIAAMAIYTAAKTSHEVKTIKFANLYNAIRHGAFKDNCLKYETDNSCFKILAIIKND